MSLKEFALHMPYLKSQWKAQYSILIDSAGQHRFFLNACGTSLGATAAIGNTTRS